MQTDTQSCAISASQSSHRHHTCRQARPQSPTMPPHLHLSLHQASSPRSPHLESQPRHSSAQWSIRLQNSSASRSTAGSLTCGPLGACSTSSWWGSRLSLISKGTAGAQFGAFSVSSFCTCALIFPQGWGAIRTASIAKSQLKNSHQIWICFWMRILGR